MDDSGNVREDLKLPGGHDDAEALARQIQEAWDDGKELVLTVLKSMNQEQVNAMKEGEYENQVTQGPHGYSVDVPRPKVFDSSSLKRPTPLLLPSTSAQAGLMDQSSE